MIQKYIHNKITWFDISNPTPAEIREVFRDCAIPTEFVDDLTSPTPHTKVLTHKQAVKITLDFPIVKRTDINHPHEIKFIATKSHLITIRFEEIEAMHHFAKEIEVMGILKGTSKRTTGGHLFLALLTFMYTSLNTKLDYLESQLQEIEGDIFNDNEKEMLIAISKVSRKLITFKQTLAAHEHALQDLREGITVPFGKTYTTQIDVIGSSYRHLLRRVSALTSALTDLRDTNTAVLTTKQNEVMKIFTILAFITFPLTLLTSLFGMNTQATPIIGGRNDFWVIVGIMLFVTIGFFWFFKYKKWM